MLSNLESRLFLNKNGKINIFGHNINSVSPVNDTTHGDIYYNFVSEKVMT